MQPKYKENSYLLWDFSQVFKLTKSSNHLKSPAERKCCQARVKPNTLVVLWEKTVLVHAQDIIPALQTELFFLLQFTLDCLLPFSENDVMKVRRYDNYHSKGVRLHTVMLRISARALI